MSKKVQVPKKSVVKFSVKKISDLKTTANEISATDLKVDSKPSAEEKENLDAAFANAEKTISTFVPEAEDIANSENKTIVDVNATNNEQPSNVLTLQSMSAAQLFKIKMFLGFVCFLLSVLNRFILNYLKKTNVPLSKMLLDDEEKEVLEVYLDSPEILAIIDKIPGWAIGAAHVEYMFISKHSLVADSYKLKAVEK